MKIEKYTCIYFKHEGCILKAEGDKVLNRLIHLISIVLYLDDPNSQGTTYEAQSDWMNSQGCMMSK